MMLGVLLFLYSRLNKDSIIDHFLN